VLVARNVDITNSFRAGIANIGSFASLKHVTISGAAFALAGLEFPPDGFDFEYFDAGGNLCRDDPNVALGPCVAVGGALEPPSAIADE
jgi:hypothetical protein